MDGRQRSRKKGELFGGSRSDESKLRLKVGRDWAIGPE